MSTSFASTHSRWRSVLLGIVVLGSFFGVSSAHAAIKDWQIGVNIEPRWNGDFNTTAYKQSIDNAAQVTNSVTLIIPYIQSNINSTDIGPTWNTPTDESLIAGIKYAQSRGLKVALSLHLNPNDGKWRAMINPSNRTAWFAAYKAVLLKYASIAKDTGVYQFTIGTELIDMAADDINPDNTRQWKQMIAAVRAVYSGKLTYSANWGPGESDEKMQIGFWPDLDSIGISAYFPLTTDGATVEGYKKAWKRIDERELAFLNQQYGKPILFTEVGYRSVTGAHEVPADFWSHWGAGRTNETEQAHLYEALYSYWNDKPYFTGIQLWNWSSDPTVGGPANEDFTPHGKQAEQVMKRYLPALPVAPQNPAKEHVKLRTGAGAQPNIVALGSATTITTSVANKGTDKLHNLLINMEVYNSAGKQVAQKIYEYNTFAPGQRKDFTYSFTPTTKDTFIVKVGVFSLDWKINYAWNDRAMTISSTGTAPADVATLDVWWPVNNERLAYGVTHTWKAMLQHTDIDDYNIFWQVDDRPLSVMDIYSSTGWPHKETKVQINTWTWKGSGPYALTFVAKDSFGNVLGQKKLNIYTK